MSLQVQGRIASSPPLLTHHDPNPSGIAVSAPANLRAHRFGRKGHFPATIRWVVAVAITLLACAPSRTAAELPEAPSPFANRLLRAGVVTNSYPFSHLDEAGQPAGFAIDLLREIAKQRNLKLEFVHVTRAEANGALTSGRIDVLGYIGTTLETPLDGIALASPFLITQRTVFVNRNETDLLTIEDLSGKKFASTGYSPAFRQMLETAGVQMEFVQAGTYETALKGVNDGIYSAAFMNRMSAMSIIRRDGLTDVVPMGQPLPDLDSRQSFAVRAIDTELLAQLNHGLLVLQTTGRFGEIYQRWFGFIDAPFMTKRQVIFLVAALLVLGFVASVFAALRQFALRARVVRQAKDLADANQLVQALFNHLPVALAVVEPEPNGGEISAANVKAGILLGATTRAPAASSGRDLPTPPWREYLVQLATRAREANHVLNEEHKAQEDGRIYSVSAVPLPSDSSNGQRVCVLAEDITQRRKNEEEIAQSRRLNAIGQLVGGIAHEFNNMATPVLMQASLLKEERTGDPELQREMDVIIRAMQRCADLTRRLLLFGRREQIKIAGVPTKDSVENAITLIARTTDKRIEWKTSIAPGLPPLRVDPTDLDQILFNLIINARDSLCEKLEQEHPEGWTPGINIEIAPATADTLDNWADRPADATDWLQISVSDNGNGMAGEVRERIFEPFYTTKEVGRGTGLGLATTWATITHYKGRIDVVSTPRTGTKFTVLLPAADPTVLPAANVEAPSLPPARRRILLLEDEELIAKAVISSLKREGHEVMPFVNGQDAWSHFAQNSTSFDLLMLDINVPGLSGLDFCARARAKGFADPIILVTGRPIEPADAGKIALADKMLPKPFTVADLIRAVRQLATPRAV